MTRIDSFLSGPLSMNSRMGDSSEKNKSMKQFNVSVMDYLHSKSDIGSSEINKYLMHIVSDEGLDGFDPQNDITAMFYFNLSGLMDGFDNTSGGIIWHAVAVLEHACQNSAARLALIHTYRFIPVLSKVLFNVIATDHKIRILSLMQKMTYGIEITWQEPQLAHLMNQLLPWIQMGDDQLAMLSLSVLVNICYKNPPSTCILMRLVDTKVLVKTLVQLRKNNNSMQVYVSKMIMILESVTGETSSEDLVQLTKVIFVNITDSFRTKDIVSLRHSVDLFIDIRQQANAQKTLAEYPYFSDDIDCLLTSVENNATGQNDGDVVLPIMALLFEFAQSLLLLDFPVIKSFHQRLVALALKCVQFEQSGIQALKLLRTITEQCTVENPASMLILQQLSEDSTFALLSFDQNVLSNAPERITSVVQLLLAFIKHPSLINRVLDNIKEPSMNLIFSSVMDGNIDKQNAEHGLSKHMDLYVNCLTLASELSNEQQQWTLYLIKLLCKPSIQFLIARALASGPLYLREQVMKLIQNGKCQFPISEVCQVLCDMESNFMACKSNQHNLPSINLATPVLSFGQQNRLDKLLNKFEAMLAKKEMSNLVTSEVMELYEHKIAHMSQIERSSQNNLELASKQLSSMNHNLALMNNEFEKTRGLLYSSQLRSEKLANEKKTTLLYIDELTENLKESHCQYQNEKEKGKRIVNDLKEKLDNTENRLKSRDMELQQVNSNYQQLMDEKRKLDHQNKEMSSMLEKYEEKLKSYKCKMEGLEKTSLQDQKENNRLKKELESIIQLRNELERKLNSKEDTISELKNELKESEQTRDLITSLLSKRKKDAS